MLDDSHSVGVRAVRGLQLSYATSHACQIMYAVSLLGAAACASIAVLTTAYRPVSHSPVITQGDRSFLYRERRV